MTDRAQFWNGIAEKYSRQPVADPAAFERKIAITKSLMRPDHVVLDVGCGTGSLALRLSRGANHVHGLDISEEMIRIAEEKARAAKIGNVTFHVGPFDETFTSLAAGGLDGVCAYSFLHLVDDRTAALARVLQLLRPGGFFASSNVCLGESRIPYRPILRVARALGKAPRVQIFPKATVEAELRAAGFVDIREHDVGAAKTIAFITASKPS